MAANVRCVATLILSIGTLGGVAAPAAGSSPSPALWVAIDPTDGWVFLLDLEHDEDAWLSAAVLRPTRVMSSVSGVFFLYFRDLATKAVILRGQRSKDGKPAAVKIDVRGIAKSSKSGRVIDANVSWINDNEITRQWRLVFRPASSNRSELESGTAAKAMLALEKERALADKKLFPSPSPYVLPDERFVLPPKP